MRKYIIPFAIVLFIISCSKDEPETPKGGSFIKFYGTSALDDGIDVVCTPDGGYLFLVNLYSNTKVLKINQSGNLQKTISFFDDSVFSQGSKMYECANGEVIVAGLISTTESDTTVPNRDIFISHITMAGDITLQKLYRWRYTQEIHTLIENPDGSFLLAGSTNSNMAGQSTNDKNIFLMHITHEGDSTYAFIFDNLTEDDYPSDILHLPDGNCLIACNSKSVNPAFTDYNTLLIETDQDGTLQNIAFYPTEDKVIVVKLLLTNLNQLFIICNSSYETTLEIIKTEEFITYTPVWRRKIDNLNSSINSAVSYKDNQFVFTGQEGNNMVIGITNLEGELVSYSTFGSAGDESGLSVKLTPDHGFIIAGTSNFESNKAAMLLKTNSEMKLKN